MPTNWRTTCTRASRATTKIAAIGTASPQIRTCSWTAHARTPLRQFHRTDLVAGARSWFGRQLNEANLLAQLRSHGSRRRWWWRRWRGRRRGCRWRLRRRCHGSRGRDKAGSFLAIFGWQNFGRRNGRRLGDHRRQLDGRGRFNLNRRRRSDDRFRRRGADDENLVGFRYRRRRSNRRHPFASAQLFLQKFSGDLIQRTGRDAGSSYAQLLGLRENVFVLETELLRYIVNTNGHKLIVWQSQTHLTASPSSARSIRIQWRCVLHTHKITDLESPLHLHYPMSRCGVWLPREQLP